MNCVVPVPGSRAPLTRGALACLLWLCALATFAAEPMIITSVSKQFIVRGQLQRSLLARSAKDDFAYLDPSTLAVTCERVKQALAQELGWGDRWRGTIYVNIRPVRRDGEEPNIIPFRTDRGWCYRIDLPDEISRRRLFETLVETLVLEFADRAATNESVELPPWFVEGLTAHLSQGRLAGMALQARSLDQLNNEPQFRAPRDTRHIDVDQQLRARVQANGALTVDQLNWADFDDIDPVATEAYHHAAHLFVRELLRLRGGPDALCAMLAMLPDHWNWQTAFLRGFEPHFTRMLDVEKWWSLTLSQWKSHDSTVHWSGPEARQKLEEILYTSMEVRLPNESTSHVTPVTLQTVLNDWTFPQQSELLQTKLAQLQRARLHYTPDLAALTDGYQVTLARYLQVRSQPGRWFTERKARAAVNDAIAALNALDQQRARLGARPTTAQTPDGVRREVVQDRPRPRPSSVWSEPRPGVLLLPAGP
jgi:hypothetical protein